MNPVPSDEALLHIPPDVKYLPLVQGAIGHFSDAAGARREKRLKLVLAGEEIFRYLIEAGRLRKRIEIHLERRAASLALTFFFAAESLNLAALNLTTCDDASDLLCKGDFAQLGLLLAARSVDRFRLDPAGGDRFRLTLEQDRDYPLAEPSALAATPPTPPFSVVEFPEEADLKDACGLTLAAHPAYERLELLSQPGKFVDLVASGDMAAALAKDAHSRNCGLIVWAAPGKRRSIPFYGPFVFCAEKREEVARLLTTAMIEAAARTPAEGLFTARASSLLPAGEFETLGAVQYQAPGQAPRTVNACYRHLREDMGQAVWSSSELLPFLQREYARLSLAREIRLTKPSGESGRERSVFFSDLSRARAEATLRLQLSGADAEENIARHVKALIGEGIVNIFVPVDTAVSAEVLLAGPLSRNGFSPKILHPCAGRSDIVLYQYERHVAA